MRRSLWLFFLPLWAGAAEPATGSVIFLHPDGTSIASWMAARYLQAGPAGRLHWDELPDVAVYDGRLSDILSASSHGGATVHAWGVRAPRESFGFTDPAARSLSGFAGPLMKEAQAAGKAVGLVQTGAHFEPGSAVHLVSAPKRSDEALIVAALVESGAAVLLGGGEALFLPEGAAGRHGPGRRQDGRNLVEEARRAGYTVLYTRDELAAAEPKPGAKFLGLFAAGHTFNDHTEEALRAAGLPHYQPLAPSYAEMTAFALRVLAQEPRGFFLVAEEEGTDNFAGINNAPGTLEAHARADAGIGVARAFLAAHPDTLVITASDSNAGGMTVVGGRLGLADPGQPLAPRAGNGAPLDGREGTGTPPFVAKPDENGRTLPFWISWGTGDDSAGGVVVRADGLNAGRVRGSMDNVDVYRVMYLALFGRELPRG